METRDKTFVKFTKVQLESVIETTKTEGSVQGFLKVWEYILGHTLEDHEGDVTPWDYELAHEQTTKIVKAFIEADGIEAGLMWMNNGPSTQQEL